MNPPYAESGSTNSIDAKTGVANTQISNLMNDSGYGYAARELFVQFVARIQKEIPNATLAMFSTLKYVNASNFEKFRSNWKAKYLNGFVFQCKAFDGLIGNFPIGFLIWDTSKKHNITEIEADALDKDMLWRGTKLIYNLPSNCFLSEWLVRPRANGVDVVPLKNAITVATASKDLRGTKWADDAIGSFVIKGPDMQNAATQALLSSGYGSAGTIFVTRQNMWQIAIIFAARKLIPHTWLNHNDQFLQPTEPLTPAFKTDCLVWMLFHGKNLTASANGLEWNKAQWNIVNHFIPFTEVEVGAKSRFESAFMVDYLKDKKLSPEAQAVMTAGREVWRTYHATQFERKIREEYKLNRPDVGWYQIRKALEAAGKESGTPFDFSDFKAAYEQLSDKLRPMVFELGFLK
jgi:hypothetical protein